MRRENVGRPRCSQVCCSEESEKILTEMYALDMSAKEIGESLGVSDQHIRDRLHFFGVKMKERGRYVKKKNGESRKCALWYVSDEELFCTRVKELALKYHMSRGGVGFVKQQRRKEINK